MMEERATIDTSSFEAYRRSTLTNLSEQLTFFYGGLDGISLEKIENEQEAINAYPNLSNLRRIDEEQIVILDEDTLDTTYAEEIILKGKFFWEHAAAGEATRLGLGTKYVIDLSQFSVQDIQDLIMTEIATDAKAGKMPSDALKKAKETYSRDGLLSLMGGDPKDLLPFTLGIRHMLQMVFDVRKIANKHKKDPDEAVRRQKTLIILNEATHDRIIKEFIVHRFYGLDQMNVFFMVQKQFHGIGISGGTLQYMEGDNFRLHNHGQMMMQKAHKDSIFRMIDGKRMFLRQGEFERILSGCVDLLSYNIEDIDYLANAIDLPSLALANNLGKKGYDMVMEIVAQNPYKPQKGGAAFYDPQLKKNVMIESNRLKGIANADIKHLNKNFNHYPNPSHSFRKMAMQGLPLPFEVKKAADGKKYIYPCPVQGDLNLLVKTAFVMRKTLKPINNWKSAITMPPTVKAFFDQEAQEGWERFARSFI